MLHFAIESTSLCGHPAAFYWQRFMALGWRARIGYKSNMASMLLRKRPAKKLKPRTVWLEADGQELPVLVVENRRSKRLTLRIMPGDCELRVTVPPRTPYREIDAFLYRHRNWVVTRLARLPAPQPVHDGAIVPFRGLPHRIIHKGRGRGLVQLATAGGEQQIHVHGPIEHLPRRVVDFFKKEARAAYKEAVGRHSKSLGLSPRSITIGDAKTRWGSCSSSGTLSFSWRIILAPPDILDYLAAHEVAHLREMNHSPRFWRLVEQICPHMVASRAWLISHGPTLHVVGL